MSIFKITPFTLLISLIILIGCQIKSDPSVLMKEEGSDKIYELQMNKVKDSIEFELFDFAEDFKFVALETNPESLFEGGKYLITKDYILVQVWSKGILQFDGTGKFLRTLVKEGEGPTEYKRCGWAVDEQIQVLYVSDIQKENYLLQFDLKNGKYLGDLKKAIPVKSSEILVNQDGQILIIPLGSFGGKTEPFYSYWQDREGRLISKMNAPPGWFNRFPGGTVQIYGNKTLHSNIEKGRLLLANEDQLEHYIDINFGKKLPDEGYSGDMSLKFNYKIGDYFFFRIFTVEGRIEQNGAIISHGSNSCYVFDQKKGKVYTHMPMYLNPIGFSFNVHEREFNVQSNGIVFYSTSALGFIEQTEKSLSIDQFKDPLRSQLKQFLGTISEESNPILTIGRIKSSYSSDAE